MLFKKKKPEAPPITDEAKYIAWFIEYSDKLDFVRRLLNLRGLSCSDLCRYFYQRSSSRA